MYQGAKTSNGKLVTGDYYRSDLDGCWIGSKNKSGYWEAKVDPKSVKEISIPSKPRGLKEE